MSLILASASPRRQELLKLVVPDFGVCPADIDETPGQHQTPSEYALGMAITKALAVSKDFEGLVLGADTVVCLGARILGKPKDKEDNIRMLAELSGRWHTVITAVALTQDDTVLGQDVISTKVLFTNLEHQDIANYVDSLEGLDKAGGYGIQGLAGKYVAGIDGCYYNVVGLPVAAVAKLIGRK